MDKFSHRVNFPTRVFVRLEQTKKRMCFYTISKVKQKHVLLTGYMLVYVLKNSF